MTNTELILGFLAGIVIGYLVTGFIRYLKKRFSKNEDWVEVDLSDDANFIDEDYFDKGGLKEYQDKP